MAAYFSYEDIITKKSLLYIDETFKNIEPKVFQSIITGICYNILDKLTNNAIKTTGQFGGYTVVNTGYFDVLKSIKCLYGDCFPNEAFDYVELNDTGFVLDKKIPLKLNLCGLLGNKCKIEILNIKNNVVFELRLLR